MGSNSIYIVSSMPNTQIMLCMMKMDPHRLVSYHLISFTVLFSSSLWKRTLVAFKWYDHRKNAILLHTSVQEWMLKAFTLYCIASRLVSSHLNRKISTAIHHQISHIDFIAIIFTPYCCRRRSVLRPMMIRSPTNFIGCNRWNSLKHNSNKSLHI